VYHLAESSVAVLSASLQADSKPIVAISNAHLVDRVVTFNIAKRSKIILGIDIAKE
jgi:hypothetical protein